MLQLAPSQIAGLWLPLRSGLYYRTVPATSLTTNNSLGIGTLRLSPFYVLNSVTLSRIGAEVTSVGDAGSRYRLGIYADDKTGYPGALVLDAGQIAGDSATVQEIIINQALSPGLYWVGGVVQLVTTTQPALRTYNAAMINTGSSSLFTANQISYGYSAGGITGSLPSAFSTSVSPSGAVPAVFVKVT